MKLCAHCQRRKPVSAFCKHRYTFDGLNYYCRSCSALMAKDWRSRHQLHVINCRKAYARRLRRIVFDHYGWVCVCCGEIEPVFLVLDHKNNDGAEHRKSIDSHNPRSVSGSRMCSWIIRHNFPDSFQVLCYNCNMAKAIYGHCPHQGGCYAGQTTVQNPISKNSEGSKRVHTLKPKLRTTGT